MFHIIASRNPRLARKRPIPNEVFRAPTIMFSDVNFHVCMGWFMSQISTSVNREDNAILAGAPIMETENWIYHLVHSKD